MVSNLKWVLSKKLFGKLWFKVVIFAALGVLTALFSYFASDIIPDRLAKWPVSKSIQDILTILASSMLAVTTFSLSVMVSAYGSATSSTPRAIQLLTSDNTTHNVLSAFIGSFVYSIVGIVSFHMGVYGDKGRVLLFLVTLGVMAIIILSLIKWIQHLSSLGRTDDTNDRIEAATLSAIENSINYPYLGATPWFSDISLPKQAVPICCETIGYVQQIDIFALSSFAEKNSCDIYLNCLPGTFATPDEPLVFVVGTEIENPTEILNKFIIEKERTYDHDPRFGFSVMAEVACRALPPAVNDPGTAIDVLGRIFRLLAAWKSRDVENLEVDYPRIHARAISNEDVFDDAFKPIYRDGAGIIEVQMRVMKVLKALAQIDPQNYGPCVRVHMQQALEYAQKNLTLECDINMLRNWVENNLPT